MANPNCLRLLAQDVRLAASRIFCTAGNNKARSNPKRARTVSSSNKVKPPRFWRDPLLIVFSFQGRIVVGTQIREREDATPLPRSSVHHRPTFLNKKMTY